MKIKLEQISEREQFNVDGVWQSFLFRVYNLEKYVGEISVEKIIETDLDSLLSDQFFLQNEKSIPYVAHIIVRPEYRGKRIAGKLAEFANDYFKQHDGISLQTGVLNSANAVRVWEKLVEEGKAEEIEYKSKRRWRLF